MIEIQLANLAETAARAAGHLVVEMRSSVVDSPDTKSSSVDLVTKADSAAEELIIAKVLAERPSDGIFGEEGESFEGTSGVRWIIDPIDGTTNYVYGIRAYGVSVAAEIHGEIVAGAVYDPSHDIMYQAARGHGATSNGARITCRVPSSIATSLVATGFGYASEQRARQAAVLTKVLPNVRDIRRSGSAALDLCRVAEGIVDAYYESGLNLWDYAAGWVIATEAGAQVSDLAGKQPTSDYLIAGSPPIADALRELIIK